MAEFVRIWDDLANVYVEYDITVEGGAGSGTGGTGTTIPVTPLNISSNVNTGVINKVIDTNDITTSINSVDIAQIFRPVVIEKSSANRFTINANIANQISVLARRDNLIVNTSGIGREGAQGEKGENSIITFNANLVYPEGSIVVFDGKIWISQSKLYGGVTPLSNPAENEFWSQIADQKYVDFLPLTSGYEVASQEEWDAIENTVELGDIIRVSNSAVDTIDIGTVNTDTEYTISDVGRALQDSSGRQYFVTGAFSGNEREIRATNREEITVADFEEALTLAGVVFGEDKLSGLNTAMNVGAEFAKDSNNVFQITNVGVHTSTSVRVVFDPIAGSGPINVGFLSNTSPNVIGNKMYSGANPGVEISEAITNLVVGNRLHVVGEESSTTQNITKIEIVGGKTYFDIADYVGYDTGDKVIGRSISNETLVAGQWYVRNSNTVDKLRLDAIGPDVVLRADVSSLQNNFPTLTTNPGLVTANTRDRADNFFMNDGLDALGEYNQTAIPFTASHVSTLRFLLLKETGGRFDSNFSDPTDNEAQNLLINSGEAFPPTDQGSQQNFVDDVIENDQNLQITTTTQSVTNGLDIEIKTLSSNAEVNVVKSVNQTDTDNDPSGLKISGTGELSLDSTNTGGDGQGDKIVRLRSDGLIPPSLFAQVNLSETETFETTTDRNDSTSRVLKMGDVSIITGDPDVTDPFIGTFVYQGTPQLVAGTSTDSDWKEVVTPTGVVASVAGKSGIVTLNNSDVVGLTESLGNKQDNLTAEQLTDLNRIDAIESAKQDNLTAEQLADINRIDTIESAKQDNLTAEQLSDINRIDAIESAKQDNLTVEQLADINRIDAIETAKQDNLTTEQLADINRIDDIETAKQDKLTTGQLVDINRIDDIESAKQDKLTVEQMFDINRIDAIETAKQDKLTTGQLIDINRIDEIEAAKQDKLTTEQMADINRIDNIESAKQDNLTTDQLADLNRIDAIESAKQDNLTVEQLADINRIDAIESAKQDVLTAAQLADLNRIDAIETAKQDVLTTDQLADINRIDAIETAKQDALTTAQLVDLNRIDAIESSKQDVLTAGTGIGISAANVISVQNASGIQVTAFAFGRGSSDSEFNLTATGDEITMVKFENGDEITPQDLINKGWIIVDGLDTELYNIAGECDVTTTDADGNTISITNAQECQQLNGTWTINSGSAILQRIS